MNPEQYYVYTHEFNNGVYYVGKGKGRRAYVPRTHNKHWASLCSKYGLPRVVITVDGLPEELSFLCEMEYIDKLRRVGVRLCNHTDGGEGISGFRYSEDQRALISKQRAEYMRKPEIRAKYAESARAHMGKPETKARMREKLLARMQDPDYRAALSDRAKAVSARPAVVEQRSTRMLELWESPDARNRMQGALQTYWADPSNRAKQSEFRKEYMRRPEVRAANSKNRREYLEKFGAPNIKRERFEFYSSEHGSFTGTRQEFLAAWSNITASKVSAIIHGRRKTSNGWSLIRKVPE